MFTGREERLRLGHALQCVHARGIFLALHGNLAQFYVICGKPVCTALQGFQFGMLNTYCPCSGWQQLQVLQGALDRLDRRLACTFSPVLCAFLLAYYCFPLLQRDALLHGMPLLDPVLKAADRAELAKRGLGAGRKVGGLHLAAHLCSTAPGQD